MDLDIFGGGGGGGGVLCCGGVGADPVAGGLEPGLDETKEEGGSNPETRTILNWTTQREVGNFKPSSCFQTCHLKI